MTIKYLEEPQLGSWEPSASMICFYNSKWKKALSLRLFWSKWLKYLSNKKNSHTQNSISKIQLIIGSWSEFDAQCTVVRIIWGVSC